MNGEAVVARHAALARMRARLSGLGDELTQLPLPGDSPTWYKFGFDRPENPETPGQPDALVFTAGAAGSAVGMTLPSGDLGMRWEGRCSKLADLPRFFEESGAVGAHKGSCGNAD